jgi:hypothetical protein
MRAQVIMEAYGSMIALGFEYLICSSFPHKMEMVKQDIILSTKASGPRIASHTHANHTCIGTGRAATAPAVAPVSTDRLFERCGWLSHVWAHLYVCMFVCICLSICVFVWLFVCVFVCLFAYSHTCRNA